MNHHDPVSEILAGLPKTNPFANDGKERTKGGADEDRRWLEDELAKSGAGLMWLDAGGSAVEDPKDDTSVRALFGWLHKLLGDGLEATGLTLHPRKRAQGEYGRRFDDLFGSREWK